MRVPLANLAGTYVKNAQSNKEKHIKVFFLATNATTPVESVYFL